MHAVVCAEDFRALAHATPSGMARPRSRAADKRPCGYSGVAETDRETDSGAAAGSQRRHLEHLMQRIDAPLCHRALDARLRSTLCRLPERALPAFLRRLQRSSDPMATFL